MVVATIGMLSSSSLHSGTRFLNNHSSISYIYRSSFCSNFHSHSSFRLNRSTNSIDRINKNCINPICTVSASTKMASPFKAEDARIPPAIPLPTPPISKFKIALCQLYVTSDKDRNVAHARETIEEAARKGAQLILLPEIWNSPYSNDSFPVYAEEIDANKSPSTAMLSEVSRRLKITIIGGSIPERSGDRLYNTCCVFGTDGKLKTKHRKIHLFDIDIPGQMTFKESKTLTAGETPTIVDTDVGRIGIGICYDIRFQELATIYAARGAHLICYPGAFNMTTGPLHWELLQRARAADCQLYVATCSPARDSNSSYVAWGHSTLVGPFGEVIATTEHDEAIVISEIDYSLIEQIRTFLPFQRQRRGDLYQLVDVQRLNSTRTS
ncbi:omega-amidase, chloroplastic-like [Olea europaea subsp. europaea]|uniref:Omega-amidase, chloroplastic-like n=2 Tax=Olea europaea subsp. europaea TaxID=158383 RepID=A0A8S0SCC3_OLEEU|nr:omega-amidase, chloroplastic-like [Olea europaea subsp. europaea]